MSVETRRLVGGAVCLDFANSTDWAADGGERGSHADVLITPEDLASWGRRAGLVEPGSAPRVGASELARAHALRRSVHDVFSAIVARTNPSGAAVRHLAHEHADAIRAAQVAGSGRSWRLDWRAGDARRIRFGVAVGAIDLLRDDAQLERLQICPGDDCGWLFLDFSGRRRWCSMEVCGSRAKMRRLYARKRADARGR